MRKLIYLLLPLLILGVPDPLFAHGGGTLQITNAPIGNCLISVWSAPPSPRVGTPLHITVGAAEAGSGEPVLDATVQIVVLSASGGEQMAAARATTEQSVNKLFYEADLPALAAGTYQFEVTTNCQGAEGVVSFEWEIRPSSNPLLITVPIGLGLLVLVGLVFRFWKKREIKEDPVRNRRPVR